MAYPTYFPYQAPQGYFQPQAANYPPQMPQVPQAAQTAQQSGYNCRPVTSREEALAVLQNVVDTSDAESAERTQALEDIATMAANIEAEANIEAMVMAKGFEQCVAIINDGMCTVVVMSDGLLPNQMSQINEIVYEQTGIKPVNVRYIEKN